LSGSTITTAVPPTVDIAAVYQCFKAYDVRGRVPDQLNEGIVWRIGRAYAELFAARKVAVGRDVRETSARLAAALAEGLRSAGATVCDIGLCGTEEIYFATTHMGLDGGIMVTASHNPPEYNGMKFVREGAQPVGLASGLREIAARAAGDQSRGTHVKGKYERTNVRDEYIRHVLSYIDAPALKPLKVVVNAGNGCAGPVIDAIAARLPVELVRINHEPDGTFPNVTQSEVQVWAQGNTVVAAYNDTRAQSTCYSGGSYSTNGGSTWSAPVNISDSTTGAGYKAANGRFFSLCRSNIVHTPAPDSGDVIDENWSDVAARIGAFAEESTHGRSRRKAEYRRSRERSRRCFCISHGCCE
jgi:hypothetical protein